MRAGISKIIVTGGAGFIGSAFVRLLVSKGVRPVVIDKLTYAGDMARLQTVKGRFTFYKADIADKKRMSGIFAKEKPKIIVHFAAETHVDRSIKDCVSFIETNIKGTQVVMDAARRHKIKRVIHISTDEVYGDIVRGKFTEESALKPNNPYAASKAAGDLLVKSYMRTYGFPAIIIRPTNNYGPWQYPEKLIPRSILRLLSNRKVAVYAKGANVREWFFVDDCAQGIFKIMQKGKCGEVYNLGSNSERKNIEVVKMLLKALHLPASRIEFVKDRPGHDVRYSLSTKKAKGVIGWEARVSLREGLKKTVQWYGAHQDWLKKKGLVSERLYRR